MGRRLKARAGWYHVAARDGMLEKRLIEENGRIDAWERDGAANRPYEPTFYDSLRFGAGVDDDTLRSFVRSLRTRGRKEITRRHSES
jgi:hypothetical protein